MRINTYPSASSFGRISLAVHENLFCEVCKRRLNAYGQQHLNYDVYKSQYYYYKAVCNSDVLLVDDIMVCSPSCADLWLLAPIKL